MFRVVSGRVVKELFGERVTIGETDSTGLPLGKSVTGFWSLDRRHAVNLIKAHQDEQLYCYGGTLWGTEVAVLLAPDEYDSEVPENARTGGYQECFDGSEVFVSKPPSSISFVWWEEFLS